MSHYRFTIANSRFLIPLLFLASLVCGAFAAESVNYDTAWTFAYDGGTYVSWGDTQTISDYFSDVKSLSDGGSICVGTTRDSIGFSKVLLMKLDGTGSVVWKKKIDGDGGNSIIITKNSDFIIGGRKVSSPWILRTDSLGNIKWSTWLYDSTQNKPRPLRRSATINCVRETSKGTFICAAGDEYPDNNGLKLTDYVALLTFDSAGTLVKWGTGGGQAGYLISGFDIEETANGNYVQAGNQAVVYIDSSFGAIWEKKYTFWLEEVGTVTNNVMRCKKLRDGTIMVAGQAYEGNCWVNYKSLHYDAWWSPIIYAYGANLTWDTAGIQGQSDIIYDFTQLIDGRLVFTGDNGKGVWAIVTDSTGKKILWQGNSKLPGVDANGHALTTLRPLSVCATSDSGFTIVGDNNTYGNNHNAFAMHWVPKAPLTIIKSPNRAVQNHFLQCTRSGAKVIFSFTTAIETLPQIMIFDAAGKRVAVLGNSVAATKGKSLVWNIENVVPGVYCYRAEVKESVIVGKFVIGGR